MATGDCLSILLPDGVFSQFFVTVGTVAGKPHDVRMVVPAPMIPVSKQEVTDPYRISDFECFTSFIND